MELTLREALETALARAVVGLPAGVVGVLAGAPIVRDGRSLDPQVQLALRLYRLAGKAQVWSSPIGQARRDLDVSGIQFAIAPPPVLASVTDDVVAGRPVRIYRPAGVADHAPAVVYFHGGGHCLGSLDSHGEVCRQMAAELPAVVVSVDYRLAPEHVFPAAADDALAAFRAVVGGDAARLGIDPTRVVVAGDSAGGNLACTVALRSRGDHTRPAGLLLIYPVLDMTLSSASMETFATGFFLEKQTVAWYREQYLGGADPRDPRASPAFVDDVTGLPPTLVVTAGFDPLRDEGDAFAARLRDHGIDVTHQSWPGLFHGFWNTAGILRTSATAVAAGLAVVRGWLTRAF